MEPLVLRFKNGIATADCTAFDLPIVPYPTGWPSLFTAMQSELYSSARGTLPLRALAILAASFAFVSFARARDAYVLISGGGTPLSNNYSQYLQARGMVKHLEDTYPKDSVWVFFGQGNRPGEPIELADVHKMVKMPEGLRESWLPGVLPNNRPARKEEILKAFREEVLPAVHDGGTLYLFVGDHGSLSRKDPKESVITLWQMENKGTADSWHTNQDQTLSVTELRDALSDGLGKGRVVFCMTQCHSGGFHYMGVPREVRAPVKWFSEVPDWALPVETKPLPAVAGFTAVDEESLAAGCDPDPDPDRWAGYERFIPEALLGVELFTGGKSGPALLSYAEAHAASVLIDQTIDKPRSSSEQYLERWATLIEKLAEERYLQPDVMEQVEAYQKAVDEGFASAEDPRFVEKRATFERFLVRMGEQNESAKKLLNEGSREKVEGAFGPRPAAGGNPNRPRGQGGRGQGGRGNRGNRQPNERTKLWTDTIRPAWVEAVKAGGVEGLEGGVMKFEKYMQEQEDKGRNYMFPNGANGLDNDLFWQSGYAYPDTMDVKQAEDITRWAVVRRDRIFDWAKKSEHEDIRKAGEKLSPPRAATPGPPNYRPRTLTTPIAAERTLFYRRTLAAWAFLLAVKEESALAQLQALMDLEATPLGSGVQAN